MGADLPIQQGPPAGAQRSPRQWQAFAEQVLAKGTPAEAVALHIAAQGCPPEQARGVVEAALGKLHRAANTAIGCGMAMVIAGVVITAITYAAAVSSGGGNYYICWGAVLFGIITFVVGLVRKVALRR